MYLANPNLYEAYATVIDIDLVSTAQSKESKVPNDLIELVTHKITLDDSLFHPQGGGQPSDKGTLLGANGEVFHVLFVSSASKSGMKVVEHYGHFLSILSVSAELAVKCSEVTSSLARLDMNAPELAVAIHEQISEIQPQSHTSSQHHFIKAGAYLQMSVDILYRQLNSRLHSAGHTIDAALKRCDGDMLRRLRATKGYHFSDGPYVEYEGELNESEMRELPNILNIHLKNIIDENIPTSISMVEKSEASRLLDLTLKELEFYPEKVRIVEVAGLSCACGGTHIGSTEDLMEVTVTKIKKKKKIIKISYIIQ